MLYVVLGLMGAAVLLLFAFGGDGMIGPLEDSQFASLVYLGALGAMIAAGIVASRQRFGSMVKQAAIWIAIILVLVIGYEYRYELQTVANRVSLGLVPGRTVSAVNADGELAVTVGRAGTHFRTAGTVNGSRQSFIVDTGASTIVLTEANAKRAGYDTDALAYTIPVSTANGMAMAARIDDVDIAVGDIARSGLIALVAPTSQLSENLLGMNFLDTLSSFEVSRDRLTLRN